MAAGDVIGPNFYGGRRLRATLVSCKATSMAKGATGLVKRWGIDRRGHRTAAAVT